MKPSSILAFGVASECVALAASAEGEPLEWVKLLPMGVFGGKDGRGPYRIDDMAHAEQIVAASKTPGSTLDPVVDFDHQTDLAAVAGVGGTAPASGWIVELQARADGIWGRVDWTPKGRAALKNRDYRYLSPVFPHSKSTGRVLAVLRAGLTNKPNLELGALASEEAPNGDTDLDKSKLATALGLGADATEDDIHAAITTLTAAGQGLALAAQAAGLEATASATDVVTAINAARPSGDQSAAIVALQAEVNTLKTTHAQAAGEVAVDAAIAAGKVTPAARATFIALHASDRAAFDAIVAAAPVIVAHGQTAASKAPPAEGELSDDELAVCAQLGVTADDFKAQKKKDAA